MRTPARPDPSARRSPRSRLRIAVAVLLASTLGLAALTGCGVGDDSGGGDSADSGAGTSEQLLKDGAPEAAGGGDAEQAPPAGGAQAGTVDAAAAAQAVESRKLARRADMSMTVDDVPAAAAQVRGVAAAQDGVVVGEEISSEPDRGDVEGFAFGTITISVPAERLEASLDALAKIGEVASRNTSTDDVTARFVDTESRVASMTASVDRVRALMTRAEKIGDIVALESELSRRQADLEALQTQLAYLEDSVALAPITVTLATSEDVLEEQDDTGFLAGLTAGWTAFTGSVTLLLTVIGALLPFAVAVALVVVPLVVWLRRRAPRTPVAPAVQAPPPAL